MTKMTHAMAADELIDVFIGSIGHGFRGAIFNLDSASLPGTQVLASKISSRTIYELASISAGQVYLPARFERWAKTVAEVFEQAVGKGEPAYQGTLLFVRRHKKGNADITADVILVPSSHTLNVSGHDEARFTVTLRGQAYPGSRVSPLNSFRRIIPMDQLHPETALPWMLQWHARGFL